MLEKNKRMKDFLKKEGIVCTPKFISKGSLKGCWRLYSKNINWTYELQEKLNNLGFKDLWGKELNNHSFNSGMFQVFTRLNNKKCSCVDGMICVKCSDYPLI